MDRWLRRCLLLPVVRLLRRRGGKRLLHRLILRQWRWLIVIRLLRRRLNRLRRCVSRRLRQRQRRRLLVGWLLRRSVSRLLRGICRLRRRCVNRLLLGINGLGCRGGGSLVGYLLGR